MVVVVVAAVELEDVDVDDDVELVGAAVVVVPVPVVVVVAAVVVVVAVAVVVVAAAVVVVVALLAVVVVFNNKTVWVGSTRAITVLSLIFESVVDPPFVSGHDTSMPRVLLFVPVVTVQVRVNVVVRFATTTLALDGPMVSEPDVIASKAAKFL